MKSFMIFGILIFAVLNTKTECLINEYKFINDNDILFTILIL